MSAEDPAARPTLVSAWTRLRRMLEAAGVSTPVLDARALVEAATGVRRIDILTDPHRPVSDEAVATLEALGARRAGREPLAYVLGRRDFWSLTFAVSPAVLTPRPETETLVETVLAALPEDPTFRILDLGTGSGAILLSVLSARPHATGLGVDASPAALDVARANAEALGLSARASFVEGDWGKGLDGVFDVVVSNPPYVERAVIDTLEPEVALFEPRQALDGGEDGLDAYRALAPDVARLLRPGGRFAFEIGRGQDQDVLDICRQAGLAPELVRPDLAGIGRVVTGIRPVG